MYSRKFTVIFHLLVTMLLINCVTSADRDISSDEQSATTDVSHRYVATTPSIVAKSHDR